MSHNSVVVAEEGNRRVGDMTRDEIEQCVLGGYFVISFPRIRHINGILLFNLMQILFWLTLLFFFLHFLIV